MKVDIKEINNFTKELNISVVWADLSKGYTDEFNKAKSKYQIPGFRKGKVPIDIIKKNLQSSIEAQFIENSINGYYKYFRTVCIRSTIYEKINKYDHAIAN